MRPEMPDQEHEWDMPVLPTEYARDVPIVCKVCGMLSTAASVIPMPEHNGYDMYLSSTLLEGTCMFPDQDERPTEYVD